MQKILSLSRLVMITPTNLLVPHMILKRFSGLLLFDYLTVRAKDPLTIDSLSLLIFLLLNF